MSDVTRFVKAFVTKSDQGTFLSDLEDQFIGKSLRESGHYGVEEIDLARGFLQANDEVLVVGSHIGTIAISLAKFCTHVTAIEANPKTFKLLKCNVILNDVENVDTLNFAASDKRQKIRFVLSRHNSGGSKRYPLIEHPAYFYDAPEVVEVEAFSLDKKLPRRPYAMVFMDIEGSEYFALQGMQHILRSVQVLFVEFLPHHLKNVAGTEPEAFANLISPHFDLLYVPGLKVTVTKENFAAMLRRMYDLNYAQEQIVFLKRSRAYGIPVSPPKLDPQPVAESDSLSRVIGEADRALGGGDAATAIQIYQRWLEGAQHSFSFVARFNLGRLLSDSGDIEGAVAAYEGALAQKPDFIQSILNLGGVRERQGRPDEAIALWKDAVTKLEATTPQDTALLKHALNSIGRLLEQQHQYAEAESYLCRSLDVDSSQSEVIHHWVHLRQKQCEWPIFVPIAGLSVEQERRAASALAMLSASNDPAEQLQCARDFAEAKIPKGLPPLAPRKPYGHDRLRIGYLSSNLNWHAVTILTAEIYELHDRSKVEVFGFCWSPEDNTPMRNRVRSAFDHLVRIDQLSDEQAAKVIRNEEIDVLIDLQGLTAGSRPTILAHQPAPVQVSWLGFPGTSAIPGVDYIVADRFLIPESEVQYYSEKPLYLPECFQSNDRKRTASQPKSRTENGLPEDAIVLCAFNHNHKFTPELFSVWMRVLGRVPGSVLWLLADNPSSRLNLEREALAQGIDSARLIFAPRVQPPDYLARFAVADLFLDTFPFNGGTTASDALWMGLPVLTCSGRTFASRMAGSLLNAIGFPELVTASFSDYENLAVTLATTPNRLAEMKVRLRANKETYPLFDTPKLVRSLEQSLIALVSEL